MRKMHIKHISVLGQSPLVTQSYWISKNLYHNLPVPEIHLSKHPDSFKTYHIQVISVFYTATISGKITPSVVRNILLIPTLYLFRTILES